MIQILSNYYKMRLDGKTEADFLEELRKYTEAECMASYKDKNYKSIEEMDASAKAIFLARKKELKSALEGEVKSLFGRAQKAEEAK